MPLNLTTKSSRLLQSRRYTHDSVLDSQEAFTRVLDLSSAEIYTEQNLIPSNNLPFSGSNQNGLTTGSVKYWYRKQMTPSNLNREVWFFMEPSASSVGSQIIDAGQQTNFVSPKYIIPLKASYNTEASDPGYAVTVITGSTSNSGIVVSPTKYAFDYKTGVLEFSSSADAPPAGHWVYISAYQYVGATLDTKLSVTQLTASNIAGTIVSASYSATASYAITAAASASISASYADTASYVSTASVALVATTASFSLTASYVVYSAATTTSLNNTTSSLITVLNSIYNSMFVSYILTDSLNYRAGNIVVLYTPSSAVLSEMSTTDIGNSSGVSFSASISASSVNLLIMNSTNSDYSIKYHYDVL